MRNKNRRRLKKKKKKVFYEGKAGFSLYFKLIDWMNGITKTSKLAMGQK